MYILYKYIYVYCIYKYYYYRYAIPHPLKCMKGGVPGNFSYISRPPPSLKRVFLYDFFL